MSEPNFFEDPQAYIQHRRQALDEAMWTQEMQGPENKIDSEISDGILNIVTDLVDNFGHISPDGTLKEGVFLTRSEAIPGTADKVPTLSVSIPLNGEGFGWFSEMTIGMQDEGLSQHVLLNKDATIRVSTYDGRPDTFMSKEDAVHFLKSLEAISTEIKEDLS